MTCERTTRPVGQDFTGVHRCTRTARWSVTTPEGETLRVCTQHKKELESYWYGRDLVVEAVA